MRKLLLLLALSILPASAAVRCVGSGGTGCTNFYTNLQLQTALDDSASGDSVLLEAGHTYSGNYTFKSHGCVANASVVVDSARLSFLPANTRAFRSQLNNMPVLSTPNNDPALAGIMVGGIPSSCWSFRGIAFTSAYVSPGNVTQWLFNPHFAYSSTASSSDLPTKILLDRDYFFLPHDNSVDVPYAIYLEAREMTVTNSTFDDMFWGSNEGHCMGGVTISGPLVIENNWAICSGIPLLTGGGVPSYTPAIPTNVTVRYNFFGKNYKWWNDATYNPYQADYIANGSKNPCMKNNGEFKVIDTATWQYNWGRLAPGPGCVGQSNGLTLTPRTDYADPGYTGVTAASASTAVVYTGPDNPTVTAGMNLCILDGLAPQTGYCRPIASINTGTKTITLTVAAGVTGSNLHSQVVQNPTLVWKDVTVRDNVMIDSETGVSIFGSDPDGTTGKGMTINLAVKNNLWVNPYVPMNLGVRMTAGPPYLIQGQSCFFDGVDFSNNTVSTVNDHGGNSAQMLISADDLGSGTFLCNLNDHDNVMPSLTFGVNGSGVGGAQAAINAWFNSGTTFHNNVTPGQSAWTCSPASCAGMMSTTPYDPQFVNAANWDYTVGPGSPYIVGGTAGSRPGVDVSTLPLITNFVVNASAYSAQVVFDLSTPIAAKSCTLEMSTSRNIQSELGTYSTVVALDPYRFSGTGTTTGNVLLPTVTVTSGHVVWNVGANMTITDDNGNSANLALTPLTTYYYLAQCAGAIQEGQFTTPDVNAGSSSRFSGAVRFSGVPTIH